MRIRTITAPNMAEALRIIRDQLGPEALILGTRKIKTASGEPTLEITAALNDADDTPLTTPVPSEKAASKPALTQPVPASPAPARSTPGETLTRLLTSHSLPQDLITRIVTALPALELAGFSMVEGLEMLLTKILPLRQVNDLLPRGQVHVFVGPSGAGKTTLIAKLAVQLRQSGTSVGLLSLDDQKIAGFEPLAVAAEALGEQAFLLSAPEDLANAARSMGPRQVMLVDTPGLNPYQKAGHIRLQQRLKALRLPHTTHLVMPGYLHGPAMGLLPLAFQSLAPSSLIFTKMDETTHFGPLVSTLAGHNIPGGLTTNHPAFAQPVQPLTGRWLAEVLTTPPVQPTPELQESF